MAKSYFSNIICEVCKANFSGSFCRKKKTCSQSCMKKLMSLHAGRPKGFKHTEEWKRQMSQEKLGENNPFYGKKHTDTAKNRIGMAIKSGKDSRNWKGGVSRIYKTGYYSKEYKDWRKSVFERDNYTCRDCGVCGSGTYLTAHHIKSFAHGPYLRFEIDNGLTLCEPCHSLTDNYKGRGRNIIKLNKTQNVISPIKF